MRQLLSLLILLICCTSYVYSEAAVVTIHTYTQFLISQEHPEGIPTTVNTMSIVCVSGESIRLSTDQIEIMTSNGTIYNSTDIDIIVECDGPSVDFDMKIETHVPWQSEMHVVQSQQTLEFAEMTNDNLLQRKHLFSSNLDYIEVAEETTRKRDFELQEKKRSIPKRKKRDQTTQLLTKDDLPEDCWNNGVYADTNGYRNCGAPFKAKLESLGINANEYSGCFLAMGMGGHGQVQMCLTSLVLKISSGFVAASAEFMKKIQQILGTIAEELTALTDMTELIQQQIQLMNTKSDFIVENSNDLSGTLMGLLDATKLTINGIEENTANDAITNMAIAAIGRNNEENMQKVNNALARSSQQLIDLQLNLKNAIEDAKTIASTELDLALQQLRSDTIILGRQLEVNLINNIQEVKLQRADTTSQINKNFNDAIQLINRFGSEITRHNEKLNAIYYALGNMTSFVLDDQGIDVSIFSSIEYIKSLHYKPLISELNPGVRPMNLSAPNVLGIVQANVESYLFNSNFETNQTGCEYVVNGQWRQKMDEFYYKEAVATFKVPIESLSKYLRFGDSIVLKFPDYENPSQPAYLISCSSCGSSCSCTDGNKMCFVPEDSCSNPKSFILRDTEDFATNGYGKIANKEGLRYESEFYLQEGNQLLHIRTPNVTASSVACISPYFDFDEFGGYRSINDAKFIFSPSDDYEEGEGYASPVGKNITFPWVENNAVVHFDVSVFADALNIDVTYPTNPSCVQTIDASSEGSFSPAFIISRIDETVGRRRTFQERQVQKRDEMSDRLEEFTTTDIVTEYSSEFESSPILLSSPAKNTIPLSSDYWTPEDLLFDTIPSMATLYQANSATLSFIASCNYHIQVMPILVELPKFVLYAVGNQGTLNNVLPAGKMLTHQTYLNGYTPSDENEKFSMTLYIPRGMRVKVNGVRPDKDCPCESADGEYVAFEYILYGPTVDTAQETNVYYTVGLYDWDQSIITSSQWTMRVELDPYSTKRYALRCSNLVQNVANVQYDYSGSEKPDVCPPYAFSKISANWIESEKEFYQLAFNNFATSSHSMKDEFPCLSDGACTSSATSKNALPNFQASDADFSFSIFGADEFNGFNIATPSSFGACTNVSENADISGVYTTDGCYVLPTLDSKSTNNGAQTWYFRYSPNTYSVFELTPNQHFMDVSLFGCYPHCNDASPHFCRTMLQGVCKSHSLYTGEDSEPETVCSYLQSNNTNHYINQIDGCETETDVISCITHGNSEEDPVICAYDRGKGICGYYDHMFDNMLQAVVPCNRRFDHVISSTNCAPSIDVFDRTTGNDPFWDSHGILNKQTDYCFYKKDGLDITCESALYSNYEECFKAGVICEFGYGTASSSPASLQGVNLNANFYKQTVALRDAYLLSEENIQTTEELCSYYNTFNQDECALKSVDIDGNAQCEYRGNSCVPRCSEYSSSGLSCISAQPYGRCLYKIEEEECVDNTIIMTSEPFCANNNCATARERCNLFYSNQTQCVEDDTDYCTWIYSSAVDEFVPKCVRKITVAVLACYNETTKIPNDLCDIEQIIDEGYIYNSTMLYCAHSFDPSECVTGIDELGKHCVSVTVNQNTKFCFTEGNGAIAKIQTEYAHLGVEVFTYDDYLVSDIEYHVTFANITLETLVNEHLREELSAISPTTFRTNGIELVPDSLSGFYIAPCEDVGYVSIGEVCCDPDDVLTITDVSGNTNTQCTFNSTNSFINPQHPKNRYVEIAKSLCMQSNDTVLIEPKEMRLHIFYICQLRPEDVENSEYNEFCDEFFTSDNGTYRGDFVCYPYIEYEACLASQLCSRMATQPCKIKVPLEDTEDDLHNYAMMVRLDSKSLADISYYSEYYLYNNTEVILDDMRNLYMNWEGKAADVLPSNVTGRVIDFLPEKFASDIEGMLDAYKTMFGPNPLSWRTIPPVGVFKNRYHNENVNGKKILKTDEGTFGYISETYENFYNITIPGTVPVWVPSHYQHRCVARVKVYVNNELVDVVEPINCLVDDPYINQLPKADETRFIHEVIPELGVVISPPFDAIRTVGNGPSRCKHIGYYHSFSSEKTTLSFEEMQQFIPDYDPRCLGVSPIHYSSAIDYDVFNAYGYDFCGLTYGMFYQVEDSITALINSQYLELFGSDNSTTRREDLDGFTPVEWWNKTINDPSFDLEEFKRVKFALDKAWLTSGCVKPFVNYVDHFDSISIDQDEYYIYDKLRLMFEMYLELKNNETEFTFSQMIETVRLAIIKPTVDHKAVVQCGNCGGMYPTECSRPAYLSVQPTLVGMSAKHGLCTINRRTHNVILDKTNGRGAFHSKSGLSTMFLQFKVGISSTTVDIMVEGCPVLAGDVTCDVLGASCTVPLFNPATEGNIYVSVQLESKNCNDTSSVFISAQQYIAYTLNACTGNMTAHFRNYNGDTCFTINNVLNATDIFLPFVSQVNNQISSIESDLETSLFNLQTTFNNRYSNYDDILEFHEIQIAGNIFDLTNMNNTIEDFKTILESEIGKLTNDTDFTIGIIGTTVGGVVIKVNQTIDRVAMIDDLVNAVNDGLNSLKNKTQSDIEELNDHVQDITKQYDDGEAEITKLRSKIQELEEKLQKQLDELSKITVSTKKGVKTTTISSSVIIAIICAITVIIASIAGVTWYQLNKTGYGRRGFSLRSFFTCGRR